MYDELLAIKKKCLNNYLSSEKGLREIVLGVKPSFIIEIDNKYFQEFVVRDGDCIFVSHFENLNTLLYELSYDDILFIFYENEFKIAIELENEYKFLDKTYVVEFLKFQTLDDESDNSNDMKIESMNIINYLSLKEMKMYKDIYNLK